jgi:hypothetical protein
MGIFARSIALEIKEVGKLETRTKGPLKVRIRRIEIIKENGPNVLDTLVEVCFWIPAGCEIHDITKKWLHSLGFKKEEYGLTRCFCLNDKNSVAEYQWSGPILTWTAPEGTKFRVWTTAEEPMW